LRPDTKLSAWLFTTLTNLCHNHHRWKRRHPTVALDAPSAPDAEGESHAPRDALAADQLTPDRRLERDETLLAVRAAIARLPHELKVTLLLHHYDRLSYREIGQITGCSERGVETRLYRARGQLKQMLAGVMSQPIA
jgi:RNA polymerase sigma-70 factor (ECF subfamily)